MAVSAVRETNGSVCCKRNQMIEPRYRCPDCIGGLCVVRVLELLRYKDIKAVSLAYGSN